MCVIFCRNEGYIPSNYVVEAEHGLERFEWVWLLKVPCRTWKKPYSILGKKSIYVYFLQLVLQEYKPQPSRKTTKNWGEDTRSTCTFVYHASTYFHLKLYIIIWIVFQNKDGGFLVRDSSKTGKYTVSLFSRGGGWVSWVALSSTAPIVKSTGSSHAWMS